MKKNRNIIDSFITAFQGIWYAIKMERNMKIHLAAAVLIILVGIWLKISKIEFAIICIAVMVVICFELINTAVEVMVNVIVDVYHPKAKIIKDVSAGAVFVSAFFSIVIGIIILSDEFIHKIMQLLN